MAILEFAAWTGTDYYVADRMGGWAAMFDILIESGGTKPPFFIGNSTENPKTEYVCIEWDSIEAHKRYKDAPRYAEAVREGEKVVLGDFEMQDFELDKGPKPALAAPITEVAVIKLKPWATEEEFIKPWKELLENLGKESTVRAISWGPSVEKKGTYGMFIGWDSVQAHKDAVAKEPLSNIVKQMYEIADIELNHVNFIYGPREYAS